MNLDIRNEASSPEAEILVQGVIGSSWWDDAATDEKGFCDALDAIPRGKKVTVGINSFGGSVKAGLGIANAIQRRGNVTTRNDGYAVSSAATIFAAGARRIAPAGSIVMIHSAWTGAEGNADDMRKCADMLETTDKALAAFLAKCTKKSEADCLAAMKAETWMTGKEAVDFGIADELNAAPVALNSFDATKFKNAPDFLVKLSGIARATGANQFTISAGVSAPADEGFVPSPTEPTKPKETHTLMIKLISALVEAKILATADGATDESATAALNAWLTDNKSKSDELANSLNEAVKFGKDLLAKYAATVTDAAIAAKRIKPDAKDAWIKRISADIGTADLLGTIDAQPAAAAAGHPANELPGVGKIQPGKPLTGIERTAAAFQGQFERAIAGN